LHGRLPVTPARVLGSGESWHGQVPLLHARGEVLQSRLGAECLRLDRRITAPIGGCELTIADTVTNDADRMQAHDILYHFNLGYPAVASGTTVEFNGRRLRGPLQPGDLNGSGDARCVKSEADGTARARVCAPGPRGVVVEFEFDTASLPYLQVWQDLRPRCGLLAIEPCASRRTEGGGSAGVPVLAPGESREYRITLRFRDNEA
jgi:hypothetical protein